LWAPMAMACIPVMKDDRLTEHTGATVKARV
jgi:hypothetical protein